MIIYLFISCAFIQLLCSLVYIIKPHQMHEIRTIATMEAHHERSVHLHSKIQILSHQSIFGLVPLILHWSYAFFPHTVQTPPLPFTHGVPQGSGLRILTSVAYTSGIPKSFLSQCSVSLLRRWYPSLRSLYHTRSPRTGSSADSCLAERERERARERFIYHVRTKQIHIQLFY